MLADATYRNIAKPSALPLNTKEISEPAFPQFKLDILCASLVLCVKSTGQCYRQICSNSRGIGAANI
jgi:hypothetical protein